MAEIEADVQADNKVMLEKAERASLKRLGSDPEATEGSSGEGVGAAKKQKGPTASNADTDDSGGDGGAAANAEQVR